MSGPRPTDHAKLQETELLETLYIFAMWGTVIGLLVVVETETAHYLRTQLALPSPWRGILATTLGVIAAGAGLFVFNTQVVKNARVVAIVAAAFFIYNYALPILKLF